MGVVYKILNKVTLVFYIGSTINFNKRVLTHKNKLRKGVHSSNDLQIAYNLYGLSNFDFLIVLESEDFRNEEQKVLDSDVYLYNSTRRASGGDMISNHPNKKAIIEKSIENLKMYDKPIPKNGDKNSNWKGGISKSNCNVCNAKINGNNFKCRKCHFETRDISKDKNPFFGKKHTESTKKNISELKKGVRNTHQSKGLVINGKYYLNATDAGIDLGIPSATIRYRVISKNIKFTEYKYRKNSNDYPEGEYIAS